MFCPVLEDSGCASLMLQEDCLEVAAGSVFSALSGPPVSASVCWLPAMEGCFQLLLEEEITSGIVSKLKRILPNLVE